MSRRDEVMAEFASLSQIAIERRFRGRLTLGIWSHDTLPDRPQHIRMIVRRTYDPCSYKETLEMIEWTLLVERLGFGKLPEGRLHEIYVPIIRA